MSDSTARMHQAIRGMIHEDVRMKLGGADLGGMAEIIDAWEAILVTSPEFVELTKRAGAVIAGRYGVDPEIASQRAFLSGFGHGIVAGAMYTMILLAESQEDDTSVPAEYDA